MQYSRSITLIFKVVFYSECQKCTKFNIITLRLLNQDKTKQCYVNIFKISQNNEYVATFNIFVNQLDLCMYTQKR